MVQAHVIFGIMFWPLYDKRNKLRIWYEYTDETMNLSFITQPSNTNLGFYYKKLHKQINN